VIYCYVRQLQGAAFNVIHFELAILLVWVVGGVANNCGLVSCGLDSVNNETFCAAANILWNSSCQASRLYLCSESFVGKLVMIGNVRLHLPEK
jgi:hypothetical protein